MHKKNYKTLLKNREDLLSGIKCIRSVMHIIANDCPIGWIAENYAETKAFAETLVTYIRTIPRIIKNYDNVNVDIQLKKKRVALEENNFENLE